jgi:hypothetical protein
MLKHAVKGPIGHTRNRYGASEKSLRRRKMGAPDFSTGKVYNRHQYWQIFLEDRNHVVSHKTREEVLLMAGRIIGCGKE